jgi:hypothetical protein
MAYSLHKPYSLRKPRRRRRTSRHAAAGGYIVVQGRGKGRKCLKTTFRSKAKASAAARRTSKRTGRACRVRTLAGKRRTSRRKRRVSKNRGGWMQTESGRWVRKRGAKRRTTHPHLKTSRQRMAGWSKRIAATRARRAKRAAAAATSVTATSVTANRRSSRRRSSKRRSSLAVGDFYLSAAKIRRRTSRR